MPPRPFDVLLPLEQAYRRDAMLAVELLDPVTLARVSHGVTVTANGLDGTPIVNYGGMFVWLRQSLASFRQLDIDPGMLPFERMAIPAAQVALPVCRVLLRARANYPFAPGVTAIRGALYEARVGAGAMPVPVAGATLRLAWLHEDRPPTWVAAPASATSVTDARGQFVTVLRFAPADAPAVDAHGQLSLRLFARRGASPEMHHDFALPRDRVTDAVYAWDELV